MFQNGAHRKAVMSLRGEVSHLTEAQELEFAQLLLPGKPDDHRPRENPIANETGNPSATDNPTDDPECDDAPAPQAHPAMRGVRFARMTGPGKSGFRPEHFSCMLKCKKRREVRRLEKALREAEEMALQGTLPPAGWAWVMDSRLVFIAKKGSKTPRPIRVGEIWRRLISKHLLFRFETKVRQAMVKASQFWCLDAWWDRSLDPCAGDPRSRDQGRPGLRHVGMHRH